MVTLLFREIWLRRDEESKEDYANRQKLQRKQLIDLWRSRGQCYMIKFGEDDIRPMWESDISIIKLREEVRTPLGGKWDCPLCQPYDDYTGVAEIDKNRRYFTRIINPKYPEGTIDEGGVYSRCPCVIKQKYRNELKFLKKAL